MLLAIDAGNTNCVFAVHNGQKFVQMWRCKTDAVKTADEYASWLFQLFQMHDLSFEDIDETILSSVVPDADFNLVRLCEKHFGAKPLMIGHTSLKPDIKILVDRPEEVGADRLVNSVAAIVEHGSPCIIIDFGTATTFDVITSEGHYAGGIIAPGVNLSMEALYQAAAKLPKVDVAKPKSVLGKTTTDAMQAGIYWGYISMIQGLLERLKEETKEDAAVIATGGLAETFAKDLPEISKVDDDLTLKGLYYLSQQAKSKKHNQAA